MTQALNDYADRRVAEGPSVSQERTDALLSAALIIGVPVVFWMSLIEIAAVVFNFNYDMFERLLVGGALIGFLAIIRGCARQSKS